MKRSQPRLELAALLRRRKTSLADFLKEFGIFTYEKLVIQCDILGVQPPSQDDYLAVTKGAVVSSPTEGVVVLEAPVETLTVHPNADDTGVVALVDEPKKARKKKVVTEPEA